MCQSTSGQTSLASGSDGITAAQDRITKVRHVLVVEDDAMIAEVVEDALSDHYATSAVETAAAALDRLNLGGVDLMLLDCSLPDGLDAGLLRVADKNSVRVILMSGDPARAAYAGTAPRPFMLKPFTLTALLEAVDQAFRGDTTPP